MNKAQCTCKGNSFKKCRYPHNGIQTKQSKKRGQNVSREG